MRSKSTLIAVTTFHPGVSHLSFAHSLMLIMEIPEKAKKQRIGKKIKVKQNQTGFGPSLARLKRSHPYSLWYEKEMKMRHMRKEKINSESKN